MVACKICGEKIEYNDIMSAVVINKGEAQNNGKVGHQLGRIWNKIKIASWLAKPGGYL